MSIQINQSKTGETHSFPSIQDAWEFIGKQGTINGNISKQKSKGRPAYGYYWQY